MNAQPGEPAAAPDRDAAHEFLTELRTRITTQPLAYQHGGEARALESLWEVFAQARDAMKRHPGCRAFADAVTGALNVEVRPVTAKWHRAHAEGRLRSRDGADAFRADLAGAQAALRRLAAQLHQMAYGEPASDLLTPPAMSAAEVDSLFAPLPFGIVADSLTPAGVADAMNQTEQHAVATRRASAKISTTPGTNAIGLALSGGGIRSATFSLGVVQVLAERNLLRDVDFLSTVSGGGYTGSFLSSRLGSNEPLSDVAGPYGPDPGPIRHLRQCTKFLGAADMKQRWSMLVTTLAGLVLNWSVPLVVIAFTALAANDLDASVGKLPWSRIVAALSVVTAAGLLVYAVRLRWRGDFAGSAVVAWPAAATALVATGWAVDAGYDAVAAGPVPWPSWAVLAGLVAAGPAVFRIMPVAQRPAVRKALLRGLLLVAGVTIPLAAVGLFYVLRYTGAHSMTALTLLAVGVSVVACLVNINLTGFHRLYRDGLARTFVHGAESGPLALTSVNPKDTAPYHLVNTTLNVPTSRNPVLRERRSDFFLFSKGWCGAPSTGYRPTADWKIHGGEPDVATAMAISGAAVSPLMGLGSKSGLRAVMALLNVRLGFWIKHPGVASPFGVPGFACLLREMTGVGMDESRPWLYLSDGGHIENLGVYELVRRRCKFVICVDGEADPDFTFHGLMTLVRHVQIDFGVRMDPVLADLRPNAETGYSQAHASLFRVCYADDSLGLFLYLKLSVTGNESELLRRYRLSHPEFPHQTTLDQFFDEEQFEAYRQLGVHVADGLFAPALLGDDVAPRSMPDWFRRLAANLLNPS